MNVIRMTTAYCIAVIVGAVVLLASPITSAKQLCALPAAYAAFGLVCLVLSKKRSIS